MSSSEWTRTDERWRRDSPAAASCAPSDGAPESTRRCSESRRRADSLPPRRIQACRDRLSCRGRTSWSAPSGGVAPAPTEPSPQRAATATLRRPGATHAPTRYPRLPAAPESPQRPVLGVLRRSRGRLRRPGPPRGGDRDEVDSIGSDIFIAPRLTSHANHSSRVCVAGWCPCRA